MPRGAARDARHATRRLRNSDSYILQHVREVVQEERPFEIGSPLRGLNQMEDRTHPVAPWHHANSGRENAILRQGSARAQQMTTASSSERRWLKLRVFALS